MLDRELLDSWVRKTGPLYNRYVGKEGGREVVSDEPLYETDFSLGRSLDEFVK